jgi:hypothetical protein
MKHSSQRRAAAELSTALHERLNTYALAASAAGVGMLALMQPAEAKIVYTPAHIKISGQTPLDLNHDGITDFLFVTSYANSTSYVLQNLRVAPYGANQLLEKNYFPRALRAGVRVGGTQHFSENSLMARVSFNSRNGHSRFEGHWANSGKGVKDRYLGLKFLINGKVHYGWARLNVTITSSHQPQGEMTGYAYETIPNKAIVTGKTKGPSEIDDTVGQPNPASFTTQAPEPATLGLLAMGSPGVSAWRREESAGGTAVK